MIEEQYDAIVIGSGVGGLATAIALGENGFKVLVVEQHEVPGGWSHSFTLEGQRFSPGVHYVGQLRSEEHTSELQSRPHLVCRLLLEKKKTNKHQNRYMKKNT